MVWWSCGADPSSSSNALARASAKAEARRRIAAQLPVEEKLRHATEKIDCSGSFEETRRQVEALAGKLRRAKRRNDPLTLFPYTRVSSGSGRDDTHDRSKNISNHARIVLASLVLILGVYWAGARYGPQQPSSVEALPRSAATDAQRDAALTTDESINVRIYRQASAAVANILTKATEYDFFMDPVPVEGAGSGFVIDPRGYILTNFTSYRKRNPSRSCSVTSPST